MKNHSSDDLEKKDQCSFRILTGHKNIFQFFSDVMGSKFQWQGHFYQQLYQIKILLLCSYMPQKMLIVLCNFMHCKYLLWDYIRVRKKGSVLSISTGHESIWQFPKQLLSIAEVILILLSSAVLCLLALGGRIDIEFHTYRVSSRVSSNFFCSILRARKSKIGNLKVHSTILTHLP